MRDHVGLGALDFRHQHREVGRRGGVALAQHHLDAGLLGVGLVGRRDADAIRAVLVDQRDLDVLRIHTELALRMLGEEAREGLAILVGMDLRAKHVLQVLVLEHGGRDRGRDPEDLLLLLDLGRERHRMRARIDAVDDVDLLLTDQAFGLVDRNVGLALGIRGDRSNLGLAADTAFLVDEIDRDLRAD